MLHLPYPCWPGSPAVGDLIPDGRRDIVVADRCNNGTVRVLENGGGGQFKLSRQFTIGYAPNKQSPAFLRLADFDRDGRLDAAVAVIDPNQPEIRIALATGGGNLGAFAKHDANAQWGFDVGDFDADGDLDLATFGSFPLSFLLNNGRGAFLSTEFSDPPTSGVEAGCSADWDSDGVPEPTGIVGGSVLRITNRLKAHEWRNLGIMEKGGAAFECADLTGDGRPDVLTSAKNGSQLVLVPGDGKGGFAQPAIIAPVEGSVYLAEIDGDGRMDFVQIEYFSSKKKLEASVWLNKGGGLFARKGRYRVGPVELSSGAAAGDLDGDGRMELIVSLPFLPNGPGEIAVLKFK